MGGAAEFRAAALESSPPSFVPLPPLDWPQPRPPSDSANTMTRYAGIFAERNPEYNSRSRPCMQRRMVMGRDSRLSGFVRVPQLSMNAPSVQTRKPWVSHVGKL